MKEISKLECAQVQERRDLEKEDFNLIEEKTSCWKRIILFLSFQMDPRHNQGLIKIAY